MADWHTDTLAAKREFHKDPFYIDKQNDRTCPRKRFTEDLVKQLKKWRDEGYRLILCCDVNDHIYDGRTSNAGLRQYLQCCLMIDQVKQLCLDFKSAEPAGFYQCLLNGMSVGSGCTGAHYKQLLDGKKDGVPL